MSCTVPTMAFDVVRRRIQARASTERIPLSASLEIIATCNFKCEHCYIAPCAERDDVMSVEQARFIFAQLVQAGTISVLLTGGEVLTHRDFDQIYMAAKRSGFSIFVNTNAYLLGERWADFFAEWPPEVVSISLYGMSEEAYRRVTNIPTAFRRVMRAIDLLLDRGIRVDLKCPAFTLTVDDIPAMRKFAESKGVPFRFDEIITPREDGGAQPVALQLAPKRLLEMEQEMNPGLGSLREFADGRLKPPRDDRVYMCGAGRYTLAVNVHGGVSTCISSRQVVGNLLEQPFEEVWAALGGKVERRFPAGHPCATCRFRSICVGCPATAEQMTGLPEGYVQQYCALTHARAHAAGLHPTGIPRTVTEGIPVGVTIPRREYTRALPVVA
jgi:radical SAM protein with 4Fe4S-binding SPASM domain